MCEYRHIFLLDILIIVLNSRLEKEFNRINDILIDKKIYLFDFTKRPNNINSGIEISIGRRSTKKWPNLIKACK